jgi:hypothetical protein
MVLEVAHARIKARAHQASYLFKLARVEVCGQATNLAPSRVVRAFIAFVAGS